MSCVTVGRLGALLAILCLSGAAAMATERQTAPFMATQGKTAQPVGHYEFCLGHKSECELRSAHEARVALSAERWDELVAVNDTVNEAIVPLTDEEVFGKPEVWVYPSDKGDCEDLVLLKRRMLAARGWPIGSLLITVVRQENGDGHAVLTVLTDRGDLVLDNLNTQIALWSTTDYQFIKRQSELNTGEWVAIDDGRATQVGSTQN